MHASIFNILQDIAVSSPKKTMTSNKIIMGLPHVEHDRLLESLEQVDLPLCSVISNPGQMLAYVYFPLSGLVSLSISARTEKPVETSQIGVEGMIGATLSLGVQTTPLLAIVHEEGIALRADASNFQNELMQMPVLHNRINRYLYVQMTQLARTVSCIHFHEIELRLAKRLLMSHDRSHTDYFSLTHQVLADMLGVQRSAVSIAAASLQQKNIIHYSRGTIHVLSRTGLEAASCACYQTSILDYQQQLGSGH